MSEQKHTPGPLYRIVNNPVEVDTPIQYAGCYVLKWRDRCGDPEVGFYEEEDPIFAAAPETAAQRDALLNAGRELLAFIDKEYPDKSWEKQKLLNASDALFQIIEKVGV